MLICGVNVMWCAKMLFMVKIPGGGGGGGDVGDSGRGTKRYRHHSFTCVYCTANSAQCSGCMDYKWKHHFSEMKGDIGM